MKLSDKTWDQRWKNEPLPRIHHLPLEPHFGTHHEPESSLGIASFFEAASSMFKEGLCIVDASFMQGNVVNFIAKRLKDFTYYATQGYYPDSFNRAENAINDSRVKFIKVPENVEKADICLFFSIFSHVPFPTFVDLIKKWKFIIDKGGVIVFSAFLDNDYRIMNGLHYYSLSDMKAFANELGIKLVKRGEFASPDGYLHTIFLMHNDNCVIDECDKAEVATTALPNPNEELPENHKFLMILPYFNRPRVVENALRSVVESDKHYKNWELAFLDDSSQYPGIPIAEKVLAPVLDHRVKLRHSNLTPQDKLAGNGILGRFMNQFIKESDADVAIMLSDDDALHPRYLKNLNVWLTQNPHISNCWSEIHPYNPLDTTFEAARQQLGNESGIVTSNYRNSHPINGYCKVDSSQTAWRTSCNKEKGVWFRESLPHSHDAFLYDDLYNACGPMYYTGLIAQFKGTHAKQLIRTDFVGAVSHNIPRE